tara:strand:- start:1022 stop:1225 length:204 start_codon:yes stop_codon:yes gene_type:complete
MAKKKIKKKSHKTLDPTWNTVTYGNSGKNPFDIEWLKYFNKAEGRDQVIFLYKEKETGKIVKHRILR